MKQILCATICITLILSLCACAPENTVTTEPSQVSTAPTNSTTETSENIATDIVVQQQPLSAVSLPVVSESEKAADGAEIFRYTYQNISLTLPDADVADKVVLNFLNRVDATRITAESVLESAKREYQPGSAWSAYQCVIYYMPTRMDSGVLSLLGSHTVFSGASHPETVYETLNYDLTTGKPLSINAIMDYENNKDTLFTYILEYLSENEDVFNLYEGYEESVTALKDSSNLNNQWYFSTEGLCIFLPPYEIAPYSSGIVIAEIPYNKLAGILNDAYFPGEKEQVPGNLSVLPFTQDNADAFTQIAELILDENAEGSLLYTETCVYDLIIDQGVLSANGEHFTKQQTVFFASSLTPGDAIMVAAPATKSTPTLRVQYSANDIVYTAYIINDGQNITLKSN